MEPLFERSDWLRSLRLAERLPRLRARPRGAWPCDRELARRELGHWHRQAPLDQGANFARRLELDGTDAQELEELLGAPLEALVERGGLLPPWLARLRAAFAREPRPLEALGAPDGPGTRSPGRAFLTGLEPLVRQGCEELDARARELVETDPDAPFTPDAARLFVPPLLEALELLVAHTFVLELGIAGLEGALRGATPEERFADFVRRASTRSATLELLSRRPVLARRLVETIESWRTAGAELLERLRADREALERCLASGSSLGRLSALQLGAGDRHAGRSVAILAFDSGLRLVYKPRSLAVDAHFQELVAHLNRAGQDPPLARLVVLERGTHGWVEFVSARSCATRAELGAFYRRQGSWLALFFALGATDLHYENEIAAGEHPVPIDLETLFHASAPESAPADPAQRLARAALAASVLRVGLLPSRMPAADESEPGFDLSGLGGSGGQWTPDAVLAWEHAGTDRMQAVRKRLPLPEARNRPVFDGVPARPEDHLEEILSGFRGTWRLLVRAREALLAPGGPIEAFAQDEVRAVVRATRFYGLLLEESQHPDFQGDALELERHFDRLWLGVEELPHLARVLSSERGDLFAGDVPVFRSRSGSRDLTDTRGRVIAGYWARSGLEEARARLLALDERGLERQEWFVRGSIATAGVTRDDRRWPTYVPELPREAPVEEALRARALRAAHAVGTRLEQRALREGEHAAWLGFTFAGGRWQLLALPDDLYGGAPGVALFLAHLASATGEERFDDLARAAMSELRARPARAEALASLGAFNGLGGLLYAFCHLARLWECAELLEQAGAVARLAAARIATDEHLDVVGGSAGFLVALESLQALDPRPRWKELQRACGEHLIARAQPVGPGLAWRTRIGGVEPIGGFSHGAAGIAWALTRLSRARGEDRWLDAAHAALRFENTLFDPRAGNWLDPESQRRGEAPADGTTMTAWCYGAPGIGLARLALLRAGSSAAGSDVERAWSTTLATGFGKNHCLCHGALGNLEFVRQAAAVLGREAETEARRVAGSILTSLEREGPLCGMPMGVESPALMNGLAGIGLGLLRLARPESVPDVLTLEAPR